jgi:hypothetical protein
MSLITASSSKTTSTTTEESEEEFLINDVVENLSPPWYRRWTLKVTKVAGSAITTVAAATSIGLNHAYFKLHGLAGRVAALSFSFSFGFSLGSLLSCLPSRAIVRRLQLEAWRLGIPLYFLLTQLYLNTEDEDEQKWLVDTMMGLWGFQLSTLINVYVNDRFHDRLVQHQIHEFDLEEDEGNQLSVQERRFRLLPDLTPAARNVKFVAIAVFGSGMITASFFIEDSVDSHLLRNFGSFFLSESIVTPLWERYFERWGDRLEKEFEDSIRESIQRIEPSKTLKFHRALKKALEIGLPISIAVAFYSPRAWTLALAGGMHGIQDESKRYPFTHLSISKIKNIKRRILQAGRLRHIAEISWRITRIGSETFALGYFGYLAFSNGNSADDFAIGTFIGSTAAGYVSTILADRFFSAEQSSPLMQTLFFRSLQSPEVLGIDPLYIYYYTVNYPIDIGSRALSSRSLQQSTIAFLSWGAYGWRLGQDLGAYESNRFESGQGRVSHWLVFSNMVALLQELEGVIS